MKSHRHSHPPYGFAIGLAAGMFAGAGLAVWLAPRLASELRERLTDSAKDIGQRASDHYEQSRNRFGEAVDAFTRPRAL
jgi:gas vesicle protein